MIFKQLLRKARKGELSVYKELAGASYVSLASTDNRTFYRIEDEEYIELVRAGAKEPETSPVKKLLYD